MYFQKVTVNYLNYLTMNTKIQFLPIYYKKVKSDIFDFYDK